MVDLAAPTPGVADGRAGRIDGEVQCIDASESMVAMAKRRFADIKWIETRVGDARAALFRRSFDAGVCTQV